MSGVSGPRFGSEGVCYTSNDESELRSKSESANIADPQRSVNGDVSVTANGARIPS